ncbi:MAG: transcriptional regulator NrdR [Christensenellaceae bacterium]|nr:transcriptional regulator NrdR [Christensenellaceae bacterium]
MRCPFCDKIDCRVVDSRVSEDGLLVRRRRECSMCGKRYTTHERIEVIPTMVTKTDGTIEQFDPAKVRNGILRSCEKRPVTTAQIDKIVQNIEKKLTIGVIRDIDSKKIGEMVMNELKETDEVAYVRFASVHLQYADLNTLRNEIDIFLEASRAKKIEPKND